MIVLTRLNGGEFALNPDLIERADSTPDTVLTLTDGTKYIVAESVREVTHRVRDFRASILARSHVLEVGDSSITEQVTESNSGVHALNPAGPDDGDDNVRVLRPIRGQ